VRVDSKTKSPCGRALSQEKKYSPQKMLGQKKKKRTKFKRDLAEKKKKGCQREKKGRERKKGLTSQKIPQTHSWDTRRAKKGKQVERKWQRGRKVRLHLKKRNPLTFKKEKLS